MIERILVVSSTEKSLTFFDEVLRKSEYEEITTVRSCGEARRLLLERSFDLCVVNAPLSDEFGESFARHIILEGKVSQVVLIVREELYEEVAAKVEEYGVLTVPKPVNRAMFQMTLKLASAAFNKLHSLQDENVKLQQKLEDMRLVSRAKLMLMQYLGMSEEQAHRYIEKQAMDMRTTRAKVATNILKTYES